LPVGQSTDITSVPTVTGPLDTVTSPISIHPENVAVDDVLVKFTSLENVDIFEKLTGAENEVAPANVLELAKEVGPETVPPVTSNLLSIFILKPCTCPSFSRSSMMYEDCPKQGEQARSRIVIAFIICDTPHV